MKKIQKRIKSLKVEKNLSNVGENCTDLRTRLSKNIENYVKIEGKSVKTTKNRNRKKNWILIYINEKIVKNHRKLSKKYRKLVKKFKKWSKIKKNCWKLVKIDLKYEKIIENHRKLNFVYIHIKHGKLITNHEKLLAIGWKLI